MSRKSKGINGERELIHMFWKKNIAALRVAGSGSCHYPVPDVLAGNDKATLAIECKVSRNKYQYFSKEEIDDLNTFCSIFRAQPFVAVKFNNVDWFFLRTVDLSETKNNFVITLEFAKEKALLFEALVSCL